MLHVREVPSEPQHPVVEIEQRPVNLTGPFEGAKHRHEQPKGPLVDLTLRQEPLRDLGQVLGRDLGAIVLLHVEEGFHQLGRVQAQQVAVFALKKPKADVAQRFERSAVTTLGTLRSGCRRPQAPKLTGEKRDNLVSFPQAVGPENNGFCFAKRHLAADVDAPTMTEPVGPKTSRPCSGKAFGVRAASERGTRFSPKKERQN